MKVQVSEQRNYWLLLWTLQLTAGISLDDYTEASSGENHLDDCQIVADVGHGKD